MSRPSLCCQSILYKIYGVNEWATARRRLLLNKDVHQTYVLGNPFGVGIYRGTLVPVQIYDRQDRIPELKQVIL